MNLHRHGTLADDQKQVRDAQRPDEAWHQEVTRDGGAMQVNLATSDGKPWQRRADGAHNDTCSDLQLTRTTICAVRHGEHTF